MMIRHSTRQPLTEDERQRQIAQLEAKRDSLLQEGRTSFFVARLGALLFLVVGVIVFLAILFVFLTDLLRGLSLLPSNCFRLPANWPLLVQELFALALSGGFVAVARINFRNQWIAPQPALGDLWGYSDRVGWDEDESPRKIQARIDALRAHSVHETEH
jgi:hypothetical protein